MSNHHDHILLISLEIKESLEGLPDYEYKDNDVDASPEDGVASIVALGVHIVKVEKSLQLMGRVTSILDRPHKIPRQTVIAHYTLALVFSIVHHRVSCNNSRLPLQGLLNNGDSKNQCEEHADDAHDHVKEKLLRFLVDDLGVLWPIALSNELCGGVFNVTFSYQATSLVGVLRNLDHLPAH